MQRLNIFISSTSRDLIDYRKEIQETVLRMGHYPIGMESFNPTQRKPIQLCFDEVQQADIFIGIYAHRYGYTPDSSMTYEANGSERACSGDRSITQMEYEWARERGIPMALYVLSDRTEDGKAFAWPNDAKEGEPGKSRLEAFKNQIMTDHVVAFFTTREDLASKVATGLHAAIGEVHAQKAPSQRWMIPAAVVVVLLIGLIALVLWLQNEENPTENANLPQPTLISTADQVVLISDFEGSSSNPAHINIARRLESDLQSRLNESQLGGVDVKVVTPSVGDETDAQTLLTQQNADALVWGWYDDLGVNVRIILAGENSPSFQTGEIPLGLGGDATADLAFVVRDVLPENVSFISLFVIGSLYYSTNDYQAGYQAMDAAMANLPDNITLENEALVHFFNGRQLYTSGSEEWATMACEYAKAIELNPDFAEAYNNLGVVLTHSLQFSRDDSSAIVECTDVGTASNAKLMFEKALELRPDLAVAAYNLLAMEWRFRPNDAREWQSQIVAIVERDPSIYGAYLMLGSIAFESGDFARAESYHRQALQYVTSMPEIYFNLGQLLLLQGKVAPAKAEFARVLQLDPDNQEAHLALANLAIQDGDTDQARTLLAAFPLPEPDATVIFSGGEVTYNAYLLRTQFDPDPYAAMQQVRLLRVKTGDDLSFENYLLGLLAQQQATTFEDTNIETAISNFERRVWLRNRETFHLAWVDLVDQCSDLATTWGTPDNPCLPIELDERIAAVYDAFEQRLPYRLYFQTEVFSLGMACPYVFTFDGEQWAFDTTILTDVVGADHETRRIYRLQHFDGRLLIRELEPETSYLDWVRVLVIDGQGRWHVMEADHALLNAADNQYVVMNIGQSMELSFGTLPDTVQAAWIIAEGYYLPYPH